MRYLEIRPGINVLKEDIKRVEVIDEMTCKIITSVGAEDSIYPSWRILMLLEQPDIEEQMIQPETPDRVNLWGNQHFAG